MEFCAPRLLIHSLFIPGFCVWACVAHTFAPPKTSMAGGIFTGGAAAGEPGGALYQDHQNYNINPTIDDNCGDPWRFPLPPPLPKKQKHMIHVVSLNFVLLCFRNPRSLGFMLVAQIDGGPLDRSVRRRLRRLHLMLAARFLHNTD